MQRLNGQVKPATNEFAQFAQAYFSPCKREFGDLETLSAKWNPEDMIPGLSDFDGRLIVAGTVGPEGMVKLDEVVSGVHMQLCLEYPRWARILEHTPGIAVTWDELYDPRLYNPETRMWCPHLGDVEAFEAFERHLACIPWQQCDEYFYLKKFAYYFSPYQRGIDPAINLGIFEPEYAWHSRAMHYFVPAIQAAIAVIKRKAIRGKLDVVRLWKDMLPNETIFDEIIEMTSKQYAFGGLTNDQALRLFENRLFDVLCTIKELVFEAADIVRLAPEDDIDKLRAQLKSSPPDPLMVLFNGIRFGRIRKSRYVFYTESPEFFASDRLLEGEFVNWTREVLVRAVLQAYGRLRCGKSDARLEEIIEAICPNVIDNRQADILRTMYEVSFDQYEPGKVRELINKIVPLWADYYLILEMLLQDARKLDV